MKIRPRKLTVARVAILAAWAGMMAWLIRFEAFPGYFSHALGGYTSLVDEEVPLRDTWMRVLHNGVPLGYTHISSEVNEYNPTLHHGLHNTTRLRLRVFGRPLSVSVEVAAYLDMLSRLQKIEFSVSAPPLNVEFVADRVGDDTFQGHLKTGGRSQDMRLDVPSDAVVYSPFLAMNLRHMRPGQELTMKFLDPLTMQKSAMRFRAVRAETLRIGETEHRAMRIAADYRGLEIRSWIDADGALLRQELPAGLAMEVATPEQAFATLDAAPADQELLNVLPLALPQFGASPSPGQEAGKP